MTTEQQSPAAQPSTPKVEMVEGKVIIDGKKYVPESDIMALKESHTKQLNEAQTAHSTAIDTAKLQVSESQKQVAAANAKVIELTEAAQSGANNSVELAKAKEEAATLKKELELLKGQSLDARRANLQQILGLTAEQLKSKTPEQLVALEEVAQASRNLGNRGSYDRGAGGGDAKPISAVERANKLLAQTPIRGVRNEPANK